VSRGRRGRGPGSRGEHQQAQKRNQDSGAHVRVFYCRTVEPQQRLQGFVWDEVMGTAMLQTL
ncbi:MAG TPA: hypothetical protein VK798_00830, partial [Alloacidobacterium sp.]|nr:hypothetical protein [Alloacidobacterium sp.]